MKLEKFNERTLTAKNRFKKELERVRACGYALDHAEQLDGVHCVGAPVLNQHGYPIAAIWITGPRDRIPETSFEALGREVLSHANRISERFGYNLL